MHFLTTYYHPLFTRIAQTEGDDCPILLEFKKNLDGEIILKGSKVMTYICLEFVLIIVSFTGFKQKITE